MPFGKRIRKVVARISMEDGFDIEVYTLIVFIKLLKFPTPDFLFTELWTSTKHNKF